jgi:DNA invertase Pin-like site-specific DNA recombinase
MLFAGSFLEGYKCSTFVLIIKNDIRRLVAKLWAQSKSETEIARELHCNISTIYRDIKFLKKLSQQFVFDLAKDLGFSKL